MDQVPGSAAPGRAPDGVAAMAWVSAALAPASDRSWPRAAAQAGVQGLAPAKGAAPVSAATALALAARVQVGAPARDHVLAMDPFPARDSAPV
jgi:hypothetical protein